MAAVKGIKEKVHLPLYDAVSIKPKEQLSKILSSNVLRFFLDVTGKTKLLTNMQASSLLPHWNTYEARAMRVVISDLPAQFPDTPTVEIELDATKPIRHRRIPNAAGGKADEPQPAPLRRFQTPG